MRWRNGVLDLMNLCRASLPKETTPGSVTEVIRQFCRDNIGIAANPVFVPVRANLDYVPGECYDNVAAQVRTQSGRAQQGWVIWEIKGVCLDAEHHTVWVSPNGELIDVTPKLDGENTVLFLPDPKVRFTGVELVENIRKPLLNDPRFVMTELIAEDRFRQRNEAFKSGLRMKAPTMREILRMRRQELARQVSVKTRRNDPCPCGSGQKYKRCCGRPA